jgi:hypothetical protein
MIEIITRPVGETFKDGETTLQVVESANCEKCFYNDPSDPYDCERNIGVCGGCGILRDDCKDVIFQKIESNE